MLKQDYLELEEVKGFISWLTKVMKNDSGYSFNHSYEIETKGKSKKTTPWKCNSFFDAYVQYHWAYSFTNLLTKTKNTGYSYEKSKLELRFFEDNLIKSIHNNDNDTCHKTCCMILDWGGVLNNDKRGNKKKINGFKSNLCQYLKGVQEIFNSPKVTLGRGYAVQVNNETVPIIMNAGFTKIYSLLCNNFIIYDGRVGASLGLLVRHFYEQEHPAKEIPKSLLFYFGKARNSKVNRNPSKGIYLFQALSSSPAVHIRNNLKANWIIQSILQNDCGEFKTEENPARCIESALFMIGYKV